MQFFKKTDEEMEALKSKLESVEQENTELREDIAKATEKDETIATLNGQVETLTTEKANLEQEISELKTQLEESERDAESFDDEVSKAAQEEVASMGITPVEESEDTTQDDVISTFKGLSGSAAVEYYNDHKQEIHKQFGQSS